MTAPTRGLKWHNSTPLTFLPVAERTSKVEVKEQKCWKQGNDYLFDLKLIFTFDWRTSNSRDKESVKRWIKDNTFLSQKVTSEGEEISFHEHENKLGATAIYHLKLKATPSQWEHTLYLTMLGCDLPLVLKATEDSPFPCEQEEKVNNVSLPCFNARPLPPAPLPTQEAPLASRGRKPNRRLVERKALIERINILTAINCKLMQENNFLKLEIRRLNSPSEEEVDHMWAEADLEKMSAEVLTSPSAEEESYMCDEFDLSDNDPLESDLFGGMIV